MLQVSQVPLSLTVCDVCRLSRHRALKTKHETPKYGLIYHASLIGQSQPKYKGKISRVLAAKCALAIRVDALGDTTDATVGLEGREKVRSNGVLGCSGWFRAGFGDQGLVNDFEWRCIRYLV
jgi:hypothetical protein